MGSRRQLPATAWVAILAVGCAEPPVDLPVLEERSLSFLDDSVERAVGQAEEARTALAEGRSDAALERLEAVGQTLADLEGYYLPLLRARELTHLARHAHLRGDDEAVRRLLGRVQEELTPAGAAREGRTTEEMGRLLGDIPQIDLALDADSRRAGTLLAELERRLNNMVLKGGLVVQPESP